MKISKEDAGAISLTRVQQQRIRVRDLVALIVATTGKDATRIAAIVGRGVFVKGMSRLRWDAFPGDTVVAACLESLPDPWPERPFRFDEVVGMEMHQGRGSIRVSMQAAASRRWFRRHSFREWLRQECIEPLPQYQRYDYELRADVFAWELDQHQRARICAAAELIVDAGLRRELRLNATDRVSFHLPRG